MKKIAAFAGSTSSTSINKQLATHAASKLNSLAYDVLDLNDYEVPIYSEDVEKNNEYPKGASEFNAALDSYDGFIISLAEHNGSYAAAFKNLFDWVSRKNKEVFRNKPVLVMATSPGARGGANVLSTAKGAFPYMGANVVASYSLPQFYENFKDEEIQHNGLKSQLEEAVSEFEKSI